MDTESGLGRPPPGAWERALALHLEACSTEQVTVPRHFSGPRVSYCVKWEVTRSLKAVTWSVVLKAWLSYYVKHRLEEVRIETG